MKNIHLLPTDNSSKLIFYSTLLNEFQLLDEPIEDWERNKNIYITSDEKIKEGDWYLFFMDEIPDLLKCQDSSEADRCNGKIFSIGKASKKIILTTDQDLIKDGVQAIDDEFLEWFVKNPSCEYVKIEDYGNLYNFRYLILIPKEEPTSCDCGANTSCQCEEPKEKTFEEILSKMTLVNPKHLRMTSNGHGEFPDGYMLTEDGVKYIVKQLKNK